MCFYVIFDKLMKISFLLKISITPDLYREKRIRKHFMIIFLLGKVIVFRNLLSSSTIIKTLMNIFVCGPQKTELKIKFFDDEF